MDSEINELKELVRHSIALSEENNKMLHKMQRSARWGSLFRILYWLLIIGTLGASYLFVSPYLTQLQQIYQKIQSGEAQTQTSANQTQQFFQNIGSSIQKYVP